MILLRRCKPLVKNLTIRHRILGSFAIILALMTIMGGSTYLGLVRIETATVSIQADSVQGLYYSTALMDGCVLNYAHILEAVLGNDNTGIAAAVSVVKTDETNLENLTKQYETTIFQPKDRENFEAFKSLRGDFISAQDEILKLAVDNKDQEALKLAHERLEPAFKRIRSALQVVVDYNRDNAEASSHQIMATIGAVNFGIQTSYVVALLLAVGSGYFLFRAVTQPLGRLVAVMDAMRQGDFTRRLEMARQDEFGALAQGFDRMTDELATLVGQVQKSGIQVNTSITEIAATSKQQQATATEIAATTTEIGATSKQISATSRALVKTMTEVSNVAEQTAALAGNGQTGLSRMEETMRHVMEATGTINTKLAVLSEKAGNINQVVTTITKVADQTNLLSLNAAIEAEKAGDYGRGFSVVATEIRRLADQTAVATFEIEQMVKEIQSAVSASVMGMDKFSERVRRGIGEVEQISLQLSQIIQQVQALVPSFEQVNEGMQAQATGAEQISESLVQLSEAAQQTVESLRQSNQAIAELTQVSSEARSSVSRFKLRQ